MDYWREIERGRPAVQLSELGKTFAEQTEIQPYEALGAELLMIPDLAFLRSFEVKYSMNTRKNTSQKLRPIPFSELRI